MFGLFLLLLTLFGVITLIFAIGVWVTETASDGRPLTDLERIGLTLPGLVAIIVIPWSWISLLRGRRCIVIEADALTARWDYPGRAVVACVPGLRRVFARGERVAIGPTGERPAVRIIRAPEGRVIEVRAGGRRARIGSDAPSQEAEDAALKWLARVLRMLIGKIGSG